VSNFHRSGFSKEQDTDLHNNKLHGMTGALATYFWYNIRSK
jgi:hypothetical protein